MALTGFRYSSRLTVNDVHNADVYKLGILLWEIYHERDASEDDQRLLKYMAMNTQEPRADTENEIEYIRLYEDCRNAMPTIDSITVRLKNLNASEAGCKFNWDQYVACIDREKTGALMKFVLFSPVYALFIISIILL